MTRNPVRPTFRHGRLLLAVIGLLWVASTPARAQYGAFGFGYGYGFNPNAYADTNYLNQRSLINAQAAAASRPKPLQAPRYSGIDRSFYDRYDLDTRVAMIDRIARDPGRERSTADPGGLGTRNNPPPRTTTPTATQTPPAPPATVHLADYFTKDNQLLWPSVAPNSGDLGKAQSAADLATLAVLNEYNLKGLASVSTVTDAREKLLAYGRPALKEVRQSSTPALADTFHVFLLALYDNIANAATVPKTK